MIRLAQRACAVGAVMAATLAAGPAQAQHHGGPEAHHHQGAPHWHGDIGRFREHDSSVWRGGHWRHEQHGGRAGWWWVVGDAWYFYSAPVYPYPDPFVPSAVAGLPPLSAVPRPLYWYYCPPAGAYYPYVATCPGGWRQIPAQPGALP